MADNRFLWCVIGEFETRVGTTRTLSSIEQTWTLFYAESEADARLRAERYFRADQSTHENTDGEPVISVFRRIADIQQTGTADDGEPLRFPFDVYTRHLDPALTGDPHLDPPETASASSDD